MVLGGNIQRSIWIELKQNWSWPQKTKNFCDAHFEHFITVFRINDLFPVTIGHAWTPVFFAVFTQLDVHGWLISLHRQTTNLIKTALCPCHTSMLSDRANLDSGPTIEVKGRYRLGACIYETSRPKGNTPIAWYEDTKNLSVLQREVFEQHKEVRTPKMRQTRFFASLTWCASLFSSF